MISRIIHQGRLMSWGSGSCGELGLGREVLHRRTPHLMHLRLAVRSVVAGAAHALCVTLGGEVRQTSWEVELEIERRCVQAKIVLPHGGLTGGTLHCVQQRMVTFRYHGFPYQRLLGIFCFSEDACLRRVHVRI